MNWMIPYAVTGIGLAVGLVILLAGPLPTILNYVVGGAFLAVAVIAVAAMIAESSGPGERGPDF